MLRRAKPVSTHGRAWLEASFETTPLARLLRTRWRDYLHHPLLRNPQPEFRSGSERIEAAAAPEELAEEAGFLAAGRGRAADEVEDFAVLKAVERDPLDPQARCRSKPP